MFRLNSSGVTDYDCPPWASRLPCGVSDRRSFVSVPSIRLTDAVADRGTRFEILRDSFWQLRVCVRDMILAKANISFDRLHALWYPKPMEIKSFLGRGVEIGDRQGKAVRSVRKSIRCKR